MDKENTKGLQEINRKLGVIIALLANPVDAEEKKISLKEQIRTLDNYGLRPIEIASILNKTVNHINKEMVSIRKG